MAQAGSSDEIEVGSDRIVVLMQAVLKKTGSGYLYQSGTSRTLFSDNLPKPFRGLADAGSTAGDIFGDENGARLTQMQSAVLASGNPSSIELDLKSPAGMMTYRIDIERIDMLGATGVLSVVTDISETRHRERVLKTLLRELSHRSKNLLAIIQGIATQTARQALSLDSFLIKFRGRIQSLASSQDLVTDSSWRGAYLFALAERQFAAYWPDPNLPIRITGINAYLSPNATLHIGLALHELIVNSASHGAIAAGLNTLTIRCDAIDTAGGNAIELLWAENLPPSTSFKEPDEHTFARTVLERVVPIAIGSKALYSTSRDYIEYRLTIPAREYEILEPVEE